MRHGVLILYPARIRSSRLLSGCHVVSSAIGIHSRIRLGSAHTTLPCASEHMVRRSKPSYLSPGLSPKCASSSAFYSFYHAGPIRRLPYSAEKGASSHPLPSTPRRHFTSSQRRCAVRRRTIRLTDLPQGMLGQLDETRSEPAAASTSGDVSSADAEDTGVSKDSSSIGVDEDTVRGSALQDTPMWPTVLQQAWNNMRKFENCVLLTRVGGFYELYFEHAEEYGPLLNLKVAPRRTAKGTVPMAGFPFFQLDRFLKTLVQDLNKHVAISEEFPNNAAAKARSGGLLFERRVNRVVTPGTLVDEKFMDPFSNNFLLAIHPHQHVVQAGSSSQIQSAASWGKGAIETGARELVGLAWLDLSTGEFFTQQTTLGSLPSQLARIGPREIVMAQSLDDTERQALLEALGQYEMLLSWQPGSFEPRPMSAWTPMLESSVPETSARDFHDAEVAAGTLLLDYVHDQLLGQGIKLQAPLKRHDGENMGIDRNSMKGLEILETARDAIPGGRGTLLHAIRRTTTRSGARLLRDRISSPSTSLDVITSRLDLVQHLIEQTSLREDLVNLLKRTFDSQRIVQKFSLGRGDADDLVSLLRTIMATSSIYETLQQSVARHSSNCIQSVATMAGRICLEGPQALARRISEAVDEVGLQAAHGQEHAESSAMITMAQRVLAAEGDSEDMAAMSQVVRSRSLGRPARDSPPEEDEVWIMRQTASPALQSLHGQLAGLREERTSLVQTLREETGAASLSLRWTPGLGHICHVKGPKDVRASMELPAARSVSSSKSTRSFYLSPWTNLGGRIDQAKLQIRAEEQRVFQSLREEVIQNLVKLRRNAAVLDELDVACSSAILAHEQHLVRPTLNHGTRHIVVGGRHPTVTIGLEEQGRGFVTNDCFVGDAERIWFITGPNMAGKSTFLRQNALISILAQTGAFVPAQHAEIGLVDHVFSRIGAADNLFHDQSTFMVEMLETAAILRNATPRSFVIMDEVGRGTTPVDGVAVSFACLDHLHRVNGSRTLFATHFHDLADMTRTRSWKGIGYYCTDVHEVSDGSFRYLHKLRPGVNRRSHALKVARLAGLPVAAIEVAQSILERDAEQHSTPSMVSELGSKDRKEQLGTGHGARQEITNDDTDKPIQKLALNHEPEHNHEQGQEQEHEYEHEQKSKLESEHEHDSSAPRPLNQAVAAAA